MGRTSGERCHGNRIFQSNFLVGLSVGRLLSASQTRPPRQAVLPTPSRPLTGQRRPSLTEGPIVPGSSSVARLLGRVLSPRWLHAGQSPGGHLLCPPSSPCWVALLVTVSLCTPAHPLVNSFVPLQKPGGLWALVKGIPEAWLCGQPVAEWDERMSASLQGEGARPGKGNQALWLPRGLSEPPRRVRGAPLQGLVPQGN